MFEQDDVRAGRSGVLTFAAQNLKGFDAVTGHLQVGGELGV